MASDVNENIVGNRAVPEWLIVKREILLSHYEAIFYLRKLCRAYSLRKNDRKALISFKDYTYELFWKIKTDLSVKDKELVKEMDKFYFERDIDFNKLYEFFFKLQAFIYELGILDIKKTGIDISKVFKRGKQQTKN